MKCLSDKNCLEVNDKRSIIHPTEKRIIREGKLRKFNSSIPSTKRNKCQKKPTSF